MKYLDTAFAQLEFSAKLWQLAEMHEIELETLDQPLIIEDAGRRWELNDRTFGSYGEFIDACQNNLWISFGAASITLWRSIEETGLRVPDPIVTDVDQLIALIYKIRCAFAHDISEPRWEVRGRFKRQYDFFGHTIDLTHCHGVPFQHTHIGGIGAFVQIRMLVDEYLRPARSGDLAAK